MKKDNTDCAWCGKPTTDKLLFYSSWSMNNSKDERIPFHHGCYSDMRDDSRHIFMCHRLDP